MNQSITGADAGAPLPFSARAPSVGCPDPREIHAADGAVAHQQRDLAAASVGYKKALAVFEKLEGKEDARIAYGLLGDLATIQGNLEEAARWFVKAIASLRHTRDPNDIQHKASRNLGVIYHRASADLRHKLHAIWEAAGIGPFPAELTAPGDSV